MPAFDRNFTPPAPVADVVVAHPVSSVRSGALRGKLDTGADLTVIPEGGQNYFFSLFTSPASRSFVSFR